jgi:hypothetical protein
MNDISPFQQAAAGAALVSMFQKKHFSVCDLDSIAETIGKKSQCAGRDYAALRALHCMDWKDMPSGLPDQVRQKCLEILGLPAEVIEVLTKRVPEAPQHQPTQEQKTGLRLAFWRKA